MKNTEIEFRLGELVEDEKRITAEIVRLLQLAEQRKIYLERGFGSMFEWLTRYYGYSEAAAQRRIQAARIVSEIPEVADKLESGELTLSAVAQVQSMCRKQKKSGKSVSAEQKSDLLKKAEGKSMRQVEALLASTFPEPAPKDKIQQVNDQQVTMQITIDLETWELLKQAQADLSHKFPDGNPNEILKEALKALHKNSAAAKRRVTKDLLKKSGNKCEFIDHKTGQRCNSKYQLEVDHIHPKGIRGSDDETNLRILCRNHNQYRAKQTYGEEKMRQFAGPDRKAAKALRQSRED